MYKQGFSPEKYLEIQSQHLLDRISKYDKLYLELGGKIFNDLHGSRVLPGFDPNMKISLMQKLGEKLEIILTINAKDIEQNRIQNDSGLNYAEHLIQMITKLRGFKLLVSSVVITQFKENASTRKLETRLERLKMGVYRHYHIEGYPSNVNFIMSDEGLGKNDYVPTTRQLVVVAAVGANSGKMATCMSQQYHDDKHGKKAGYAKFEKFPVWNLSLNHPINLAYEAATTNIMDKNLIDPYHLEAYGTMAVNYNRDVEAFPVLNAMFTRIWGESPYKSPTDMGVNMIKECITDEAACMAASKQEIIRRYYGALCKEYLDGGAKHEIQKLENIMTRLEINLDDRITIPIAEDVKEVTGKDAVALELAGGDLVTGKTTKMLSPSAAVLINALKQLARITDNVDLISSTVIEPIQRLNLEMGTEGYLLKAKDMLVALSISSVTNPTAELALKQLPRLHHGQAHSTTILDKETLETFKILGIDMTCQPADAVI